MMLALAITANLRIGNNVDFGDGLLRQRASFLGPGTRQQIPSIMTSNAAEEELLLPQRRASKQADASDSACVLQNDK